MADDFGLQFSPSASMDRSRIQGGSGGDPNQGVQEAIRTLSLRIPRVAGAQGFSPLINAPGSQGVALPGGVSLEQLLMAIFGRQQQPGVAGTPGAPLPSQSFAPSGSFGGSSAPPAPNFTPGVGPGEPIPGASTPGGEEPSPTPSTPAPMGSMLPNKFDYSGRYND